jgi:hypothetical protein
MANSVVSLPAAERRASQVLHYAGFAATKHFD